MARRVGTISADRSSGSRVPQHGGPHDVEQLDPRVVPAANTVDFGALRVPVPADGTVTVEPTTNGRMQAVHVTVPEGRLSVSALAAAKSGKLWPDLATEIDASLREGGARVRSYPGDWGRELHATTGAATSVFVGVDGPRWMVYGVATGPTKDAVALDSRLRRLLRGTIVVRGRSPYPVRTVLPLVAPPDVVTADPPPAVAGAGRPGGQTGPSAATVAFSAVARAATPQAEISAGSTSASLPAVGPESGDQRSAGTGGSGRFPIGPGRTGETRRPAAPGRGDVERTTTLHPAPSTTARPTTVMPAVGHPPTGDVPPTTVLPTTGTPPRRANGHGPQSSPEHGPVDTGGRRASRRRQEDLPGSGPADTGGRRASRRRQEDLPGSGPADTGGRRASRRRQEDLPGSGPADTGGRRASRRRQEDLPGSGPADTGGRRASRLRQEDLPGSGPADTGRRRSNGHRTGDPGPVGAAGMPSAGLGSDRPFGAESADLPDGRRDLAAGDTGSPAFPGDGVGREPARYRWSGSDQVGGHAADRDDPYGTAVGREWAGGDPSGDSEGGYGRHDAANLRHREPDAYRTNGHGAAGQGDPDDGVSAGRWRARPDEGADRWSDHQGWADQPSGGRAAADPLHGGEWDPLLDRFATPSAPSRSPRPVDDGFGTGSWRSVGDPPAAPRAAAPEPDSSPIFDELMRGDAAGGVVGGAAEDFGEHSRDDPEGRHGRSDEPSWAWPQEAGGRRRSRAASWSAADLLGQDQPSGRHAGAGQEIPGWRERTPTRPARSRPAHTRPDSGRHSRPE